MKRKICKERWREEGKGEREKNTILFTEVISIGYQSLIVI